MKQADGDRLAAALKGVLEAADAPSLLLGLISDADATTASRRAAYSALTKADMLCAESAEAIFALAALWSNSLDPGASSAVANLGLNLYNEARALPITALMHRCGCGDATQVEAMRECGIKTVSDLVFYCSDIDSSGGGDVDECCSSLWMETGGAVQRPALRQLVHEARAICDATAALHGVTAESGNALGLASADLLVDEVEDDDLDGIDDDGQEEEGPVPGTRSVGC